MWARSGRDLFYVDSRRRLVSVPIQAGAAFTHGNPVVAVECGPTASPTAGRDYDVSPDGRRFLVLRPADNVEPKANPPQLNVVLNWGEELKRLAPAKR